MGPSDRARVTAALQAAASKARELIAAGEFGEPLGEILQRVNELVALVEGAPVPSHLAGEGAPDIPPQLAERVAALEEAVRRQQQA